MMTALRNTAADTLLRFTREGNGSIATMTGILFPVFLLAAGGATDITRAQTIEAKAQQTLDATVLSMARSGMTDAEIEAEGPRVFTSWITARKVDADIAGTVFTARKTGAAPGQPGLITANATMTSKTYFLGLFGHETLDIAINSSAQKPNPLPYEISLVLDVSGSMNEMLNGRPRIDRMKEAATGMLDEIERQSAGRAAPAISLVPYSTSVNIGDLGTDLLAGVSVSGAVAPFAGDDVWAAERLRGPRGDGYDLSDDSPASAPVPFVTGIEIADATPTSRLQGPSTIPSVYRNAIAGMRAEGWTAAHMGMIWGVYALSPNWSSVWSTKPRPHGEARKVIVVLTDGAFNTTHAIGDRSTDDGETSNRYFQSACDLAKTRGITIYTIALALDATSEARLAACADGSGGGMFPAKDAKGLTDAFKNIAKDLGGLRLSS